MAGVEKSSGITAEDIESLARDAVLERLGGEAGPAELFDIGDAVIAGRMTVDEARARFNLTPLADDDRKPSTMPAVLVGAALVIGAVLGWVLTEFIQWAVR